MVNHVNSYPSGASGQAYVIGLFALLTSTPSSFAATSANQFVTRLDGATYTTTPAAPSFVDVLQSGNIKTISRHETFESQVQSAFSGFYMNQKDLDPDMARVMYARLADLYEE